MKILIISHYFYPEQFRINEITRFLLKKKNDVRVIAPHASYPNKEYFISNKKTLKNSIFDKITIRHKIFKRSLKYDFRIINYISYIYFGLICSLRNQSYIKKSELIITPLTSPITSSIVGLLISRIFKKKYIIILNDIWPESILIKSKLIYYLFKPIINIYQKYLFKQSHKIFIQDKEFSKYVTRYNIKKNKIEYLPNWSPIISNSKPILEKKINFLYIGNIGYAQDFDLVFDLIQSNSNYHLNIVGDGREINTIKKKIIDLNLKKFIKFFPYQDLNSFKNIFSQNNFGILTLKNNIIADITTPGKYQLYLSSGLPVVAINIKTKKKEIIDNKLGFYCNDKSISRVSHKINLISNKEYLIMRSNSKKIYKKLYMERIILDNFYKNLNK